MELTKQLCQVHHVFSKPLSQSLSSMNLLRPSPSAHDIQNHLYASFLDGSAADVALRVRGSWHAVYNLHRVVLIQSVCRV
jgi:hypothetical protein